MYESVGIDKPVAYLWHEATKSQISVYKKMNRFQRFMIRICFGLKYVVDKRQELRGVLLR